MKKILLTILIVIGVIVMGEQNFFSFLGGMPLANGRLFRSESNVVSYFAGRERFLWILDQNDKLVLPEDSQQLADIDYYMVSSGELPYYRLMFRDSFTPSITGKNYKKQDNKIIAAVDAKLYTYDGGGYLSETTRYPARIFVKNLKAKEESIEEIISDGTVCLFDYPYLFLKKYQTESEGSEIVSVVGEETTRSGYLSAHNVEGFAKIDLDSLSGTSRGETIRWYGKFPYNGGYAREGITLSPFYWACRVEDRGYISYFSGGRDIVLDYDYEKKAIQHQISVQKYGDEGLGESVEIVSEDNSCDLPAGEITDSEGTTVSVSFGISDGGICVKHNSGTIHSSFPKVWLSRHLAALDSELFDENLLTNWGAFVNYVSHIINTGKKIYFWGKDYGDPVNLYDYELVLVEIYPEYKETRISNYWEFGETNVFQMGKYIFITEIIEEYYYTGDNFGRWFVYDTENGTYEEITMVLTEGYPNYFRPSDAGQIGENKFVFWGDPGHPESAAKVYYNTENSRWELDKVFDGRDPYSWKNVREILGVHNGKMVIRYTEDSNYFGVVVEGAFKNYILFDVDKMSHKNISRKDGIELTGTELGFQIRK